MQSVASILATSHPEKPHIAWHLIVNRTAQRGRTSCSLASLCIALNGLLSARSSGSVDKTICESQILDILDEGDLHRNLSEGTGGATLDQILEMANKTIVRLEIPNLHASVHRMEEASGAFLDNFRKDLSFSAKHSKAVLIANYHQGVATGKDFTHGHHAPVAPLGEDATELCVVDPAQEGFSYVLDIEQMAKAMATVDKTSGINRGYLKISES